MTSYVLLMLAICFEVAGTAMLKLANGFTNLVPSMLMVVFYLCTFGLMAYVVKELDVSLTYAIWSGVGTALIAVIGVLAFHEPINALKIASLLLIIAGVVGLNLSGGAH